MKRMLSMLLCALLLWGTAAPAAAAEETAQDRLARVTQTVKDVLDLDTGAYDDFQGECHEREAVPVWTLRWEGDDRSLTVEALEDGTVVSFYLGESAVPVGTGQSFPAFPAASAEEAASAAEAFLAKVLDPPLVSARLEASSGMDWLGSDSYTFSGQLLLHGLPSPLAYSITVRAADAQVIRFRRDIPEETFLGDIPAAQAAISQDRAAQTLAAQLGLTLEYVLPEAESTSAVLRYVPAEGLHTCYVDAADGSLIDLTALTGDLWSRENASGDTAAAAESGGGLSPAEQAGIEKLEGVLSSSRLDRLLREEAA